MDDCLDEKVVQTIVQKLGYTEQEVRKYVATDKNSFVGVLYQKLVDDQNDRKVIMERQNQQLMQRQLQLNLSQNTASDHNISAKLPIHPSYVPSIGCFSSLNNQQMNGSQSKLSLNNTSSHINLN